MRRAPQQREPPRHEWRDTSVFKRFRIELVPKYAGPRPKTLVVEVRTRTAGGARRAAVLEHPEYVVSTIERIP
jgi:hypothetical protein